MTEEETRAFCIYCRQPLPQGVEGQAHPACLTEWENHYNLSVETLDVVRSLSSEIALDGMMVPHIPPTPDFHRWYERSPQSIQRRFVVYHSPEGDLTGVELTKLQLTTLPPTLLELSGLTFLDLSGTTLRSPLSNMATIFPQLQTLVLANAGLERWPDAISTHPKLEQLYLDYNTLGQLPEGEASLPCLCYLGLRNNRLNTLPSLEYLPSLEHLDLGMNKLSDLPNLATSRLKTLVLSSNRFEHLPPSLFHLPTLEVLELHDNRIQRLPPGLGNLRTLQELSLSADHMTTLPRLVGSLTQLRKLFVRAHELPTPNPPFVLPVEIGYLTQLRHLELSHLKIRHLPNCFDTLTNIQVLRLPHNLLANLPPSLRSLEQLRLVDLQGNLFSQVPDILRSMRQLEILDLSENPLRTLPSWIGDLTNLRWLSLRLTDIRRLPPSTRRLEQLHWLGMPYNIPSAGGRKPTEQALADVKTLVQNLSSPEDEEE